MLGPFDWCLVTGTRIVRPGSKNSGACLIFVQLCFLVPTPGHPNPPFSLPPFCAPQSWPDADPRSPHHHAAYLMLRETGIRITASALRAFVEDHPI